MHRKDGCPPAQLAPHFQPKRPTKNIVYYADRVRQLESTPSLAYHSPHKPVAAKEKELRGDICESAADPIALGIMAEDTSCEEGSSGALAAERVLVQLLQPARPGRGQPPRP